MATPSTIDKSTKVNLGILITLLVIAFGGGVKIESINGNVLAMETTLGEVRNAIDRNTEQIAKDSRTIAILETLVKTIDRRVAELEHAKPK